MTTPEPFRTLGDSPGGQPPTRPSMPDSGCCGQRVDSAADVDRLAFPRSKVRPTTERSAVFGLFAGLAGRWAHADLTLPYVPRNVPRKVESTCGSALQADPRGRQADPSPGPRGGSTRPILPRSSASTGRRFAVDSTSSRRPRRSGPNASLRIASVGKQLVRSGSCSSVSMTPASCPRPRPAVRAARPCRDGRQSRTRTLSGSIGGRT
jgi:hypothetical protein